MLHKWVNWTVGLRASEQMTRDQMNKLTQTATESEAETADGSTTAKINQLSKQLNE